ncbi:hypothetical protein Gotri_009464 [Gossypium trilobum]|uniref:Uncharacterized protein n=1 Tax=Gossypium trilobum TaxID=34281 RepID=A0A7J9EMJ6_9ROSI|nr:hypothetical protein [Gossypium trilobum]
MARFIRTAQRAFVSAASKTLTNGSQSRIASASSLLQFNPYATSQTHKSPFTAKIIRILSNEIENQLDYAPPISLLRVSIPLRSETDRERCG